MKNELWVKKIKAFLHDPPDKALKISGHKGRRDEILKVIGITYDNSIDPADWISSAMQRLNIPSKCDIRIDFENLDKPVFKHTLSAKEKRLQKVESLIAEEGFEKGLSVCSFSPAVIKPLVDSEDWRKTYFTIWRFLPEKYPLGNFIPADTRIPDHSIWDHLDITAAIASVLGDFGLFAVKVPSVQEFISSARKLSDLWAGSHMLSYLIFRGVLSIIWEYGPDVVIFPHLRGHPLLDKMLKEEFLIEIPFEDEMLDVANLPNTFLCVIPNSLGEEIGTKVKEFMISSLKEISNQVKEKLKSRGITFDEQLWGVQINNAVSVFTTHVKVPNRDVYERIKNDLPKDLVERQDKWLQIVMKGKEQENLGHFYGISFEILQAIIAQKSRMFEQYEEREGRKCSMCGIHNFLIEGRKLSEHFGTKMFKEEERLCAICLTKRFYREVISKLTGTELGKKFESVVEISARDFINATQFHEYIKKFVKVDIELLYRDQWKLKEKEEAIKLIENETGESRESLYKTLEKLAKEYGEPNKYYAILMMDGDNISKMLSGEKLESFGQFLHPTFKKCIEDIGMHEVLSMKRMLSPSVHIAISRALKYFSINKLKDVVNKHKGFLVYSGGDDVLALFPTNTVLDAAKEIEETFSCDFYEINGVEALGPGKNASMSAGIVFAHYKYPLYDALQKVREALEEGAKKVYGRRAFCASFIKRSGELITSGGKWDFVDDLLGVVKAILDGKVSNRFIYDFIEVSRILSGDMLRSEIKRLLERRKEKNVTKNEITEIYGKLACLINKYSVSDFDVCKLADMIKILCDAMREEE